MATSRAAMLPRAAGLVVDQHALRPAVDSAPLPRSAPARRNRRRARPAPRNAPVCSGSPVPEAPPCRRASSSRARMPVCADVTGLLDAAAAGDPRAAAELLPLVYDELRKLAAAADGRGEARPDPAGHRARPRGLSAAGRQTISRWNGRGHFFAAAAEAMRRILVENARRKAPSKRGGAGQRIPLDDVQIAAPERPDDLLDLDEALTASKRPTGRPRSSSSCVTSRPDHSRGRGRTRPRAANGGCGLGLCPGLAARPVEGSGSDS